MTAMSVFAIVVVVVVAGALATTWWDQRWSPKFDAATLFVLIVLLGLLLLPKLWDT